MPGCGFFCRLTVVLTAGALAACSSGGDSAPTGSGQVMISGTISFDLVPVVAGLGLDYAATEAVPARGVTVELVSAADEVLAATSTDLQGSYSLAVAADTTVFVRAKAELARQGTPGFTYRVRDNINGNALYALDGTSFSSGQSGRVVDLHAASGWDESTLSYSEPRAAAPFAILDVIFEAVEFVLAADPALELPLLDIYWSPDNVPNFDADGSPDLQTGEIGGTFFAPALGIYLLGAVDEDTDEYDRHVIVHEWTHHLEEAVSRTDNIGGPHSPNDQLDLRVAFSEGLGNAVSAMVVGDPYYRDAGGPGQARAGGFDIESTLYPPVIRRPGWFSETSVHEILYDLYDDNEDSLEDILALGFAPLFEAFRGGHADALGLTSIFTFIDALNQIVPLEVPVIDALVGTQSMAPIVDEFGSNEQNSGHPSNADILPIYRDLSVGGGAVNVCSSDDFASVNTGSVNKLGSRQFLKFSVPAAGTHTIAVTATDVPDNRSADPDMVLHRRGSFAVSEDEPGPDCTAATPLACEERMTLLLAADDYVLEVYEYSNTATEPGAAIGRTCFDVEVSL